MTVVARPVIIPLAALAVVVIGAGLVADGHTGVQTEPERWVAQSSTPVHELRGLRDGTGSSSELDVLVEADDVTATGVVEWMERFAAAQVRKHPHAIARYTSMPAIASSVTGVLPVQSDVTSVVKVAPRDVKASLLSPDGIKAALVFPMKYVSLEERSEVVDAMKADLASPELRPPAGVRVTPAGLAVVGIELMKGLTANRAAMTLLSIAAVALWLLLAYRRLFRAVLPLVPVLFAVGLSSGIVWLMGWELTPLTTVVAPLAIAVTTEFSVLIMARYLEERDAGRSPEDAVRHGAVRIGRAFVASGLTLLGGFAVLSLSPLPLLGEFGVVVAVIVLVALVAALATMPPLLVWHDRLGAPEVDAPLDGPAVRIEEGVPQ
jgi:predicted RND superfamily exporter protein